MEKNVSLLLILLFFTSVHPFSSAFTPATTYFILCGSNNSTTTIDGRAFVGDSESKSLVLSTGSEISVKDPNPSSDSSSIYQTARIFTGTSKYKFDIKSKGTHLVRFHFYPFFNRNYNLSSAIFDVSAVGFTLLKDFGVPNKTHVFKEYIINIDTSEFIISFKPSGNSKPLLAFVNAIEVFSAPNNLASDPAQIIPRKEAMTLNNLSSQTLETVYRINVGGPNITPESDSLWRNWIADDKYLLPNSSAKKFHYGGPIKYEAVALSREIAPDNVYNTAREMDKPNMNITWKFPVMGGFQYLVRMHFCDIVSQTSDQLYFNVYIQDWAALENLHPAVITTETFAAPFYRDFIIAVPESSGFIRVSVGPSKMSSSPTVNAILNGLEILKKTNSSSSLGRRPKISIRMLIIGLIAGAVVVIGLLGAVAVVVIKRWRVRKQKKSGKPNTKSGFLLPFSEIKLATNNFDENYIVGKGGFGNVYKGVLRDGRKVAVKRRVLTRSAQGLPEFQAEIKFLTRIRHRHLVSLIGYCEEQSEMILVYEYMENGPLKKHLYGSDLPCLSWNQRLKICIGAARGLHYLHTGFPQGIIHRDLKSVNILLDEDYLAKVADFGLSKVGPSDDETHVSTIVKGTFGYIDPEYFRTCQLTVQSDIYSFAILLLEVMCAQPVIDFSREEDHLADWAMLKQGSGSLGEIVDPRIAPQISPDSLMLYWETVVRCLANYGEDRPTISTVLCNLEQALRLQETASQREAEEDGTPSSTIRWEPSTASTTSYDDKTMETSFSQSKMNSSQAFSQWTADDSIPFVGSFDEKRKSRSLQLLPCITFAKHVQ